jgi:hypothetical protein
MELFLERLLMELLVVAMQLAFLRLLAWFRDRSATNGQVASLSAAA